MKESGARRASARASGDEAIRLLTENRSRLDAIAEALLREETLDQPQAYAAAELAPPSAEEAAPVEAAMPAAM